MAVMFHVPSASAGRSHDDTVGEATNVHVAVVAPFVAVTVTVKPAVTPMTSMAGVESLVMSSTDDDPESDAASRSGTFGAAGALNTADMVDVARCPTTSRTE